MSILAPPSFLSGGFTIVCLLLCVLDISICIWFSMLLLWDLLLLFLPSVFVFSLRRSFFDTGCCCADVIELHNLFIFSSTFSAQSNGFLVFFAFPYYFFETSTIISPFCVCLYLFCHIEATDTFSFSFRFLICTVVGFWLLLVILNILRRTWITYIMIENCIN